MEPDTKTVDKLNRGRTLRLALPHLLPYIKEEVESVTSRIVGKFRQGQTDFLAEAAELATLIGMRDEFTRVENETKLLEEKIHGN